MKKFWYLFGLFVFITCPIFAEHLTFSASSMTGQAGSSNTTTMLSGNAYIKTETLEIHADNVELSGEDFRFIKASGNVDGKNLETKMDFSCDNLEYDRETKIAILKGNVKFKDIENDVEANAQIIEYNQNTEISVLQINITLKQEDNVCNGSYGVYYKEKQLLELSGNAQVQQKDDLFRAQHITLNLDTQEITLDGNVKGSVTDTKVVEESEDGEDSDDSEDEKQNKTQKVEKGNSEKDSDDSELAVNESEDDKKSETKSDSETEENKKDE